MKFLKLYISNIGITFAFLFFCFLINPFNQGSLFVYPLILLIVFKKNFLKTSLDFNFVLLFFISIIYALFYLFDPIGGVQFVVYYAFFPCLFYLFGKHLTRDYADSNVIFYLFIAIGILFSFSALVSVTLNFLQGGFSQLDRSLPFFWTGQLFSATKMGSFFTFNMCLPALLIADQNRSNLLLKIIATLVFGLTLICVIRIGSRTQLVVMLLTTIVSLFYVIPKQSAKKNTVLFLMLLALVFYVYKNVSFDLNADWLSTFAGRMEGGSGEVASGGGRTERWVKSIEYIFEKPLGWSLDEFGYSHNLWLDALRSSGIITFILLIIFTFRSFYLVIKTIKINRNLLYFNVLILVYGLAFFLLFMVEPILEGMFSFFLLFCLFFGILTKYNTVTKSRQNTIQNISDGQKS